MAIELDNPVSVNIPVVQQTQLICDQLFVLSLITDATNPQSPTAKMELLPFCSNNGQPIFASPDSKIVLSTKNIYAAAQNIPEIGIAMQAVFNAAQAWYRYTQLKAQEMAQAQSDYQSSSQDSEAEAKLQVAISAWEDAAFLGEAA